MKYSSTAKFGARHPDTSATLLDSGTPDSSGCPGCSRGDASYNIPGDTNSSASVLNTSDSCASVSSEASEYSGGDVYCSDDWIGDTDTSAAIFDTSDPGFAEYSDFAAMSVGLGGLEVANLSSLVIG